MLRVALVRASVQAKLTFLDALSTFAPIMKKSSNSAAKIARIVGLDVQSVWVGQGGGVQSSLSPTNSLKSPKSMSLRL